jgi:multicomponent Na+:H+ antiporter subunit F
MQILLAIALVILSALEMAALFKVLKGPSMPDRLAAANVAVTVLTFILAVAGALKGSDLYYDAALAAALLSFSRTMILAKFISTGEVM